MKLVDLLADPARVADLPSADLEQLLAKFPQSEHVHLVRYLHHLQNTGEIDQKLLAKASAFSSNRSVLADLTQRYTETQEIDDLTIVQPEEPQEIQEAEEILPEAEKSPEPKIAAKQQPAKASFQNEPIEVIATTSLAPTWIIPGAEDDLKTEKSSKSKTKKPSKTSSLKKSSKRKRKKRKKTRLTKIIEEQKVTRDPFANGESNEFLQWLKRVDQLGTQQASQEGAETRSKKQKKKKSKKKKKESRTFGVETDIISETLAELVAQQGRPRKAIAIYEQLRLKYPEKSAFFALKIKDLQDKSE